MIYRVPYDYNPPHISTYMIVKHNVEQASLINAIQGGIIYG